MGVVAQPLTADRGGIRVRPVEILELGAVDRRRPAGAALVDDEQVAPVQQRVHELEVGRDRAARRVAGAALMCEDRAEHLLALVARREEDVTDPELAAHLAGRVPGSPQLAALGARPEPRAGPAVEPV